MTELAVPENNQPAVAPQPDPDLAQQSTELMRWVEDARQANLVAQSLASTSFVPASLRGKPADITAAILAGQELGMKPMTTLKSIDVIQGTPALRAHAMRGILQQHGHEIELVDSSPEHCIMRGRRAGAERWQEVTWTIERAAALGLTGKDQWKKQPQTMLIARATGEICRLVASDALHGMPYASEELDPGSPAREQRNTARPLAIAELAAPDAD
ncbi:hypothetical protein [Streptomyces sp. NPDC088925]|uniref:hypothetical protein n=1 Tax=Streptomyces sp. NPDC088925 TaxID=3365914 RepID=UPI0037FA2518